MIYHIMQCANNYLSIDYEPLKSTNLKTNQYTKTLHGELMILQIVQQSLILNLKFNIMECCSGARS